MFVLIGVNFYFKLEDALKKSQAISNSYFVQLSASELIMPEKNIELKFKIINNITLKPVEKFKTVKEKLMHVIILDSQLASYQHLYPEYLGNGTFIATARFPYFNNYRFYIQYAPDDLSEYISIINTSTANTPDYNRTAFLGFGALSKSFGDYNVTLSYSESSLNGGIGFEYTLRDVKTGNLIDISKNISELGYFLIVGDDGLTFPRAYAVNMSNVQDNKSENSIKFNVIFQNPGWYKLFWEFSNENKSLVTDFNVKINMNYSNITSPSPFFNALVEVFNDSFPGCVGYG